MYTKQNILECRLEQVDYTTFRVQSAPANCLFLVLFVRSYTGGCGATGGRMEGMSAAAAKPLAAPKRNATT